MFPESLLFGRRTIVCALRCSTTVAAARTKRTFEYNSTGWLSPPSVRFSSSSSTTTTSNSSSDAIDVVLATDWIPPPPKSPSTHETVQVDNSLDSKSEEPIDWLATRRRKLSSASGQMLAPGETAQERRQQLQKELIPVKKYTLLSQKEIVLCLETLGGQDIVVSDEMSNDMSTGGVLATGRNNHHLRVMADALVRHMRARQLQDVGVVGAELGVEGHTDDSTETWFVVDCENYVVHLQDEITRKQVKLELMWSEQDELFRIDCFDETQVNRYVAANPVPDGYGDQRLDWMETYKQLQKNRWVAPHKQIIPAKKRGKRRSGRG